MNILSIETSSHHLSLAIGKKNKVLSYRNETLKKRLSVVFFRKLNAFLKKNGLELKDIDAFCVGLGPGYFTSMRVGLSAVKGYALALQKPVVGFSSLDAVVLAVEQKPVVCILTDARRQLLYVARYRMVSGVYEKEELALKSIEHVLQETHEPTVFAGNGAVLYQDVIQTSFFCKDIITDEKRNRPQARYLLPLAWTALKNHPDGHAVSEMTPLYLYPENCQVTRT